MTELVDSLLEQNERKDQEIERLKAEIEDLKHDISEYIKIASNEAGEVERLEMFNRSLMKALPIEKLQDFTSTPFSDEVAQHKAEQEALARFETLLSVCENEFGYDDDILDDGPVMLGSGPECQITFKLLRDCRTALDALKPTDKEGK